MGEDVQSIGVAAVVALLILQQVQKMLADRSPTPPPVDELHKQLVRKVDDLHQWHALEDEDGVKRDDASVLGLGSVE